MIVPGTQIICPVRVPLDLITVASQAVYYPAVVEQYRRRLCDPDHPHDDVLLHLIPCGVGGPPENSLPLFRVIDGRHRFLASLLAGRQDVLAIVELEPAIQPSGMQTLIVRLMATYPQERPCDQEACQREQQQQRRRRRYHDDDDGDGPFRAVGASAAG